MTISEVYDPSTAVAGGLPDGGMGDYIESLKDDCGFLIEKIDWAVEMVTSWSLLEALFKPLAGDFQTISGMQQGWGNVGAALGAVGDNYESLSSQLPAVWTGEAAAAGQARLRDIADMHQQQVEATGQIQEQLGHVIEVSKATAEVVAAAVNFINDVITEILIDAAAGPLGWVKGSISAPGKAKKIIDLIHRGLTAIEKLTAAAKAAVTVLKYANAGLAALSGITGFGAGVANTAAGNFMDDSATQGFG